MNTNPHTTKGPDPVRSRLRATMTKLEHALAQLGGGSAPAEGAHAAAMATFADLTEQLALGPEPEVRECPKCGGVGMRMATVCSGCWTKLTPLL